MSSSSNPLSDLGNAVNKAVNQVGDVGQAIINNPLPIIETAVLTAALGPEGIALSSAIGAPATAAVSAAAVEAANGGNVNQIATAAASAGVGSEVTQLVAPEVGPSPISGAATNSTNPLASAAGGAAGGATQAALTGQDVAKGALTGGAVSGLASAGAQEVSSLTSPGPMSGTGLGSAPNVTQPTDTTPPAPTVVNPMTETTVNYGPNSTSLTAPLISTAPTELANYNLLQQPAEMTPGGEVLSPTTYNVANPLTGGDSTQGNFVSRLNSSGEPMIPTEGGLGIIGDPNVVLPASFAAYATYPSQMRAGSDGTLIPAYQNAADTITPGGMSQYNLSGSPQETITAEPQTTPGLSLEAQNALQSIFGFGLSLIGPKGSGVGAVGANTPGISAGTTGTTSSTTGGSPGGTELDPSTGKAPELAWGDKYSSLKEGLNV